MTLSLYNTVNDSQKITIFNTKNKMFVLLKKQHYNFGVPLFLQLLEFFFGEVPSDPGLQPSDNLRQTVITHFLKTTQYSGSEEYL